MSIATFILNGRRVMKVNPAAWMLNSQLIKDHVNRQDFFIVDMETGELTVVNQRLVDALVRADSAKVIAGKVRVEGAPTVDVQFYRNKLREISASAKAALGE